MPLTSDAEIAELLTNARTIAMVCASDRPERASNGVMKFLQSRGYRVLPVNSQITGEHVHGEYVWRELSQIGEPIDIVDIFRRSEFAGEAVDQAIAAGAKAVWMQLGVIDEEAAARAEAAGLKVVMNRCPKIEYGRLSSEISWMGVNSRTLSSKKAPLLGGGIQRMSLNRTTSAGGATAAAQRAEKDGNS